MKPLILLIDDDRLSMESYIRAIMSKGLEVKQCFDPDTALEVARKQADRIKCIVLDIMMGHGERYSAKDTNEGLKTGVLLHDDLRPICPNAPIVVLTNVNDEATLSKFYDLGVDVRHKLSCLPFEFAEMVTSIIEKAT